MSFDVTGLNLDEIDERRGLSGLFIPQAPTHVDQLQDCEPQTIRKTLGIRNSYLTALSGAGESLTDRATLGAPVSRTAAEWLPLLENQTQTLQEIQSAALKTEEMPAKGFEFPNLAWESLRFGLAKENFINNQLNHHIDEIREKQQNISLLLDLSSEIGSLKEDDKQLPARATEILDQLKQRGIDLRKENQSIEELKRQASSRESDLRSQMQIAFTTEVQRLMQHIESIHQILQNIIRSDAKVKEKANQLQK